MEVRAFKNNTKCFPKRKDVCSGVGDIALLRRGRGVVDGIHCGRLKTGVL
jgi:hypothetical protein